jgi:Family of unknown function (DUF6267)
MKIIELLTEAVKARIDHPEDITWQEGSKGVKRAMQALADVLANPQRTSIKWDGSPALIFGRDANGDIVITDKSGFGAKGYDGKARSQQALRKMITARDPGNPDRVKYANTIASLWPIMSKAIPADLRGYYQGDLLWVGTPPVEDNKFVFKPNKVTYRIPVDSELGKRIAVSKMGMVVHGFLPDEATAEPTAISDVSALQGNPQFVVLGAEMPGVAAQKAPKPQIPATTGIDELLNPTQLKAAQLTNLGALIGRYMAALAGAGEGSYANAAKGFIQWLDGSGESPKKIANAKSWIADHTTGYNNLWAAIAAISAYKAQIKSQLDKQTSGEISASLGELPGHEGYVAATPHGKIKLVDRHVFMRK